MKKSLGHCAFGTCKLEEMMNFYIDKLGLTHHFNLYNEDGSVWLVYLRTSDGQFIELFNEDGKKYSNEKAAQQHICMIVDSIDEAATELQNKGVQLFHGPTSMNKRATVPFAKQMGKCGSYGFFVADPDGNEIEFHEFTDKSLQIMDDEKLSELEPLINSNLYVPEAADQGSILGR